MRQARPGPAAEYLIQAVLDGIGCRIGGQHGPLHSPYILTIRPNVPQRRSNAPTSSNCAIVPLHMGSSLTGMPLAHAMPPISYLLTWRCARRFTHLHSESP
eukprot:8924586-Pyramimonas_sp.AAC.1